MTPGARLAAAIEVFATIESERRPAADALKAWGLTHRFAGSGDRAGIAGLVYDALRRRASSARLMGSDTPRAVLLGMLRRERGLDADAIGNLANGAGHAPPPLTDDERARLGAATLDGAPAHVAGDYPEWLDPHLQRVFGNERAEEGAALSSRAPLDLRANTLNADRDKAAGMLSDLAPEPTRWSPWGLRIRLAADAKSPAIHAEPAFLKGMVEIQDEGSQLAALFAAAKPGEQVVDLCAGARGDDGKQGPDLRNRRRQAPARPDSRAARPFERAQRAGAHAKIGRRRHRRSRRPHRSCADRRTLHRHRRLAPQPRRQMAYAAGCAGAADQGAGGNPRSRRAVAQGRRAHLICDLLSAR